MVLAIVSCDDFIDHEKRGVQNLDKYFETPEECEYWLNDLYLKATWVADWWQLTAPRITNEVATDDAWMGNTSQSPEDLFPAGHYLITPSRMGNIPNIYIYRFESITRCNQAIHRIPNSKISDELKDKYIGEALFLRAYNYLELVNNFGALPLCLEELSTSQLDKVRSPKEDIYSAIEGDLIQACKLLKADATKINTERGRANKWAAQALLARAYLYQSKWEKAYTYADSVITTGPYQLETDFVNIWKVGTPNCMEVIFETQTSDQEDKNLGNQMSTFTGARGESIKDFPSQDSKDVMDGWGWGVPTSDLENCYLSENDDIRRKSTIITWGEPVYGDETHNPTYKFDLGQNKSGRAIRKYYIPIETRRLLVKKRENAPLNVPVIRLAEMYLTRAEASFHKGNVNDAMDDVDFVRARVNLAPKKGTVTGNNALRAIWKERRMELAFEGLRLYDIRRQIDPDTNKPVIASILGPNGSFVKYNTQTSTDPYELTNKGELQNKGTNFDLNKHLVWPIPQAEIDRSGGTITQNPGY